MNFDTAFDRLIGNEGGYVCNPNDPGGETCWGVTVGVARANGYVGAMQDLPRATAKAIYRAQYWAPVQGDSLPMAVSFQVFDAAVNHGVSQASMWLQSAAAMDAGNIDGNVGPGTVAAVLAQPVDTMLIRFNAMRLRFYTSLQTWDAFGRGWARRVATNLNYAAIDLSSP